MQTILDRYGRKVEVVEDGESINSPMMFKDSRPHSVTMTDAQTKTVQAARDEYDKRLEDAWRNPAPQPVAATATPPAHHGNSVDDAAKAFSTPAHTSLEDARRQQIADLESAWQRA